MTDLRDIECLTVDDRKRIRESRWTAYMRDDVESILDTLDVAVIPGQKAWRHFAWRYRHVKYGPLKSMFCDLHGITRKQAEQLGIFGEGT